MRYGLDYAWHGTLKPEQWIRDGISFVCRYVSRNQDKDLTRAEAQLLAAYGLDIVLVWETTATRALEGYHAGVEDAIEAFTKGAAVGLPSNKPIYFAVDTDTTPEKVIPYFTGIRSMFPSSRVGVYGGYKIIEGLVWKWYCDYGWQTSAWSYGKWSSKASIQQFYYSYCGGGLYNADLNRTEATDFGQWRFGQAVTPPPVSVYYTYTTPTTGGGAPPTTTPTTVPTTPTTTTTGGIGAGISGGFAVSPPPQETPTWDYSGRVRTFGDVLMSRNSELDYYSRMVREIGVS